MGAKKWKPDIRATRAVRSICKSDREAPTTDNTKGGRKVGERGAMRK
jgi:hypothetical protein